RPEHVVHRSDAGVVDEHVDVSVVPPDLREHLTDGSLIRDVQAEVTIRGDRVVDRLAAAADDLPAGSAVVLNEVLAEALASPGDHHPPGFIGHGRSTALRRSRSGCRGFGTDSWIETSRARRRG